MIIGWLAWLLDVWLIATVGLIAVRAFMTRWADSAGPLFRWAGVRAVLVVGWLVVCGLAGQVDPVLFWVGLALPFARWGWRWSLRPVEQWTEDRL